MKKNNRQRINNDSSIRTRSRQKSINENEEKIRKQIDEEFEKQKQQAKLQVQNLLQDENSCSKADLKKEIVKGRVAVDECFLYKADYHVYEINNQIYDSLLNQTNIASGNNNNKFYIAQILESDKQPFKYYFFTRWGRVGQKGQHAAKELSLQSCIDEYEQKIYDKTVAGDYKILEKFLIQQNTESSNEMVHYEKSMLQKEIKNFLKLIYDVKMMDKQMMEIGYDSSKMPLGKLGNETIKKGYCILKKIAEAINETKIAKAKKKCLLESLSSDFYSYIPHNNGYSKLKSLDSNSDIKEKLEMLASLEAIEIATSLIQNHNGNIFDNYYFKLNSKIKLIDTASADYDIIEKYVENTHGSTHSNYNLKVLEIFKIKRKGEKEKFKNFGNRMLLWHGSRLTNFVGIISQGLRIAPPEAPCTGYMFGKGVYFADSVSKSANYCCTSPSNPVGLILLCDVSLGKWQERTQADYEASNLEPDCQSTKGIGKMAPTQNVQFSDFQVPIGKLEDQQINSDLMYNEYIVYNVDQVQIKYLVKLEFIYKQKIK
ncbi:unnamed protein product [Paramecium pentaurelia]|uniref:Poly [ADP-ribose] polymerase n=1 Tax=Paramecium pentaurelia TaxID=43138 RepID=A0A8S1V1Z3_9CILI|nr:unnamed protein product [Paramecium pentaurelia]